MIHKNSLVDSSAVLGENVQIGPFSIIGKNQPVTFSTFLETNRG